MAEGKSKIRWTGRIPKWTLKEANELTLQEIRKMPTEQRAELAQFYYRQFQMRAQSFVNAQTVGYALTKVYNDFAKASEILKFDFSPDVAPVIARGKYRELSPMFAERKAPQNVLWSYISRMQDFFKAKSSTVSGWRAIGEEQDKRIFGVNTVRKYRYEKDENGKRHRVYYDAVTGPKYRMTDAERSLFWMVYDEIYRTHWTGLTYSSDSQREFGTLWMKGDFSSIDFETAYTRMSELLNKTPDYLEEHSPGVAGDPFQPKGGSVFEGFEF